MSMSTSSRALKSIPVIVARRFWSGAIAFALVACSQGGEAPSGTTPESQSSDDAAAVDNSSANPAESEAPEEVAADSGDDSEANGELASIEQTVLEQINAYRQEQGLEPLTMNPTIRQQAQQHSTAMARGEAPVSHQGFESRVETIAKSVDYRSAAENVAYNEGYGSPGEQAVNGWLESPMHLENIRGDYDLTGVGVARDGNAYYFTQIFIRTP